MYLAGFVARQRLFAHRGGRREAPSRGRVRRSLQERGRGLSLALLQRRSVDWPADWKMCHQMGLIGVGVFVVVDEADQAGSWEISASL